MVLRTTKSGKPVSVENEGPTPKLGGPLSTCNLFRKNDSVPISLLFGCASNCDGNCIIFDNH